MFARVILKNFEYPGEYAALRVAQDVEGSSEAVRKVLDHVAAATK